MIGEQAEATAIHDHGRAQRSQAGFQFPDDLPDTGSGILVRQYVREIQFRGTKNVHQCPGGAARFEKYIIDVEPRRPYRYPLSQIRIGNGGMIAGKIRVDDIGRDTVAESPGQAAEAFLDLRKPLTKIVGAAKKRAPELPVSDSRSRYFSNPSIASRYSDSVGGKIQDSLSKKNIGSAAAISGSSRDCD